MEVSDSQTTQNTFITLDEQHTCEEFNYRNCQISATNSESIQTPSQAQIPECYVHQYSNTSITTGHCVKDRKHKEGSDRLPSDNNHCQTTVLKPSLKIIKKLFGKDFEIWLSLFVIFYKSQFMSTFFSTTHFLKNFILLGISWRWHSIVSTGSRLQARQSSVRIPAISRNLSLLKISSPAQGLTYSVVTVDSYPGCKLARTWR